MCRLADRVARPGGGMNKGESGNQFPVRGAQVMKSWRNQVISKTLALVALAASLGISGVASANNAQNPEERGIPMGGFTLFPEVTAGVGFDDNVYAATTGEVDDIYYTLQPTLTLASNWSVHSLVFEIANENVWYSDVPGEDRNDLAIGARARIDVTRATAIHLQGLYDLASQDRSDPDDFGSVAERTTSTHLSGSVGLHHEANNVGIVLGLGLEDNNYDDADAFGGGTFDNDARDHQETTGIAELNFRISPDTRAFVRGTYSDRDYDQKPPAVLTNRNSTGYDVVGGFRFGMTEVIEGEVYAGYLSRDYDVLTDIDGFKAGAEVEWAITPLTTIIFEADRSVHETNLVGSTAYVRTEGSLGLRHELLRNLMLGGAVGYANDDFEGIARDDDVFAISLDAEYLINPNLALTGEYLYQSRDSNLAGLNFDRNVFWAGLTGRF